MENTWKRGNDGGSLRAECVHWRVCIVRKHKLSWLCLIAYGELEAGGGVRTKYISDSQQPGSMD